MDNIIKDAGFCEADFGKDETGHLTYEMEFDEASTQKLLEELEEVGVHMEDVLSVSLVCNEDAFLTLKVTTDSERVMRFAFTESEQKEIKAAYRKQFGEFIETTYDKEKAYYEQIRGSDSLSRTMNIENTSFSDKYIENSRSFLSVQMFPDVQTFYELTERSGIAESDFGYENAEEMFRTIAVQDYGLDEDASLTECVETVMKSDLLTVSADFYQDKGAEIAVNALSLHTGNDVELSAQEQQAFRTVFERVAGKSIADCFKEPASGKKKVFPGIEI